MQPLPQTAKPFAPDHFVNFPWKFQVLDFRDFGKRLCSRGLLSGNFYGLGYDRDWRRYLDFRSRERLRGDIGRKTERSDCILRRWDFFFCFPAPAAKEAAAFARCLGLGFGFSLSYCRRNFRDFRLGFSDLLGIGFR